MLILARRSPHSQEGSFFFEIVHICIYGIFFVFALVFVSASLFPIHKEVCFFFEIVSQYMVAFKVYFLYLYPYLTSVSILEALPIHKDVCKLPGIGL